jgi:HlyD family secretion protein
MIEAKNERSQGNALRRRSKPTRKILLIFIGLALIVAVGAFGFSRLMPGGSSASDSDAGVFVVKRGKLTISVSESGNIKAVKSELVKSEVEGRPSIVNIVPEGTYIKPEDVNNMVLVELDSSQLREQLPQRQIELASAEASDTEAKEAYDIQLKQNESDVTAAQLAVKFAMMDLQKYLGEGVALKVIEKAEADPGSSIDMASLVDDVNDPNAGSEASQKLRELTGNITLARSNLEKAIYTLEWTEKLHQKQYVAETELRKDKLEKQRLVIDEEKARIALALFLRYEFAKQTEQLLSDYKEAKRELERTEARARSQLAQAKAKRASAEATLGRQKERLSKLEKQLTACIIKAPAPGQVVYWSSTERWVRIKIEQGAEIPEGYRIITIPDSSEMKVEVKIHETWIDKIEPNQPAEITVEAFPDKVFKGRVLKKAPLADAEDWLNPDLKVYSTDVGIEGTHDFLKTGMTGKVKIIIDELDDVLYVPIQSVVTVEDKKYCYLAGGADEKKEVETGLFNDNFVEIKTGLTQGEEVLLNPPRWTAPETTEEKAETESESEPEQKATTEPNETAASSEQDNKS